ncbi:MAG: thymidine phosphorylase [Kiritimatiellae bacterium]|nr:thymidine phosphorylase [Kiritimatiellia bacterium]
MVPQWIIEKKRDGGHISEADIRELIDLYSKGEIPDYQMSAFLMAVYFKGMSFDEVTALTDAMMRSGDVLDFSNYGSLSVDKHSTGGVGDKLSIPLAPLVAAVGVVVPMISGRGLGITGGTLDKLESIPGYNTQLTTEQFQDVLAKVGCSIIGQTARLAPADKKLYALRDVTGTVPSIPLISASIMSKKLAEGAAGLVLDVKCGRGAFMKSMDDARTLAKTMQAIGRGMGRNIVALLTNMDSPLGEKIGNTLEIEESIDVLKGKGPADIRELTMALAVEMVLLAKLAETPEEAKAKLEAALESGAALQKFRDMVIAQGGDARIIDDYSLMPQAPVKLDVCADASGYVETIDADAIGRMVLLLGGGRRQVTDSINYGVGISNLIKLGTEVKPGDRLMTIHAASEAEGKALISSARDAVTLVENKPSERTLIFERLA